ncbi:MAG: hypothetical protein LH480_14145 [Rubrivivax sp.]|nr:hypothetical protein [Rubrivivax sp.]
MAFGLAKPAEVPLPMVRSVSMPMYWPMPSLQPWPSEAEAGGTKAATAIEAATLENRWWVIDCNSNSFEEQ